MRLLSYRAAALAVALVATALIQAPVPAVAQDALSVMVSGNRLVTSGGEPLKVAGVNRSGSEFECIQGGTADSRGWGLFDGPIDKASAQAIAAWHVNVVRLPLNEDCWLGINDVNPVWGGAAYQRAVEAYVATLHSVGLRVVLDLHWSAPAGFPALSQQPLPDADHSIDFWRSVAARFRADPAVLFDLYNEPFLYGSYLADGAADQWRCWRFGCRLTQFLTGGQPYAQNYSWKAAGMQQLIDAVRGTGARQPILVAGLGWANDLSGWLANRPQDPAGQLVASWHSYPGQGCSAASCWDQVVRPISRQVPVIIGEVGDSVCKSAEFLPAMLSWADGAGIGYLGWTWNTWGQCDNILIKDQSGTPTSNYGVAFRAHLATLATHPGDLPRSPAHRASGHDEALGRLRAAPAAVVLLLALAAGAVALAWTGVSRSRRSRKTS
jgi:endoglucanase